MKIALLLILAAVVAVTVGCAGSHPHASGPQGIDVVAANARSVLKGRRLVFSLGRWDNNADIWEVSPGGLANLTRSIRKSSHPQPAYPLSLSPDGDYVAFFLQMPVVDACSTCYPLPYFIRSDGHDPRRFGTNLCYCIGFPSFWPPSWDPSSHSFVIAAPKTGLDQVNDSTNEFNAGDDDDTGLFRFKVPSGKETELTQPGRDSYDYAAPTVSPDGRKIAFFRSAAPEPTNTMNSGVAAYVYVMSADGRGKRRLALPARAYASLWWCRGSGSVCIDTAKHSGVPTGNTYRVVLQTGKITLLRKWPEAAYVESGAVSPDASFAVSERTSHGRAELLAGPLSVGGTARLKPIVIIPHTDGRRFLGVSVSR
jgi:WD40 repeat protein